MQPPDVNLRVKQAGRVCDALAIQGLLRADILTAEVSMWARRFAACPKAYAEFDRLVLQEQRVLKQREYNPLRRRRRRARKEQMQ